MRYAAPRHIVIDDAPTPVPFWAPDRVFRGLTVAVIGGGPSHAELDVDLLDNVFFIAVNSACRKVRPAATKLDILYFSDNSWNENRPELAASWPGRVVSCNRNTKARLGDAVLRLNIDLMVEYMQARVDYVQASSGHVAAVLAAYMGAKRVVLIGFEGKAVNGRTHGHDDYSMPDTGPFEDRFLPGWRGIAPAFKRRGVEVINATPDSAIQDFPYVPVEIALGTSI